MFVLQTKTAATLRLFHWYLQDGTDDTRFAKLHATCLLSKKKCTAFRCVVNFATSTHKTCFIGKRKPWVSSGSAFCALSCMIKAETCVKSSEQWLHWWSSRGYWHGNGRMKSKQEAGILYIIRGMWTRGLSDSAAVAVEWPNYLTWGMRAWPQ